MQHHEILLHLFRREKADLLHTNRPEDVLLEIRLQVHARNALDQLACPVDVGAVLPDRTGLVDERLIKEVMAVAGEFVDAGWEAVAVQFGVEEGVAEAGC